MKISKEIKLGSILLNTEKNEVEIVTIDILKEILELEEKGDHKKYGLINIIGSWLENYFGFEKVHNGRNGMDVYTHIENGFRLHKRKGRRFQLGYSVRERHRSLDGELYSLNELDDCMFLFTKLRLNINTELIERINTERVGW